MTATDGRLLPPTGHCHGDDCDAKVTGERKFCGPCAAKRKPDRRYQPAECGTYAAYQQHKKLGEDPCEPCTEANREYRRIWRQEKANRAEEKRRAAARNRALSRLQAMHPTHYRALYREELGR